MKDGRSHSCSRYSRIEINEKNASFFVRQNVPLLILTERFYEETRQSYIWDLWKHIMSNFDRYVAICLKITVWNAWFRCNLLIPSSCGSCSASKYARDKHMQSLTLLRKRNLEDFLLISRSLWPTGQKLLPRTRVSTSVFHGFLTHVTKWALLWAVLFVKLSELEYKLATSEVFQMKHHS